jgi:hypothetical protein
MTAQSAQYLSEPVSEQVDAAERRAALILSRIEQARDAGDLGASWRLARGYLEALHVSYDLRDEIAGLSCRTDAL